MHRLLSVLCALGLALCPTDPLLGATDARAQGKVPAEYIAILHRLNANDYDHAIRACQQLIAREPEFDRAYLKLVEAYRDQKALESARSFFQALLNEQPQNAYAYYGLGLTYYHNLGLAYQERKPDQQVRDYYDRALQNFKKSLALSPQFPSAFYWLIQTYGLLGKLDEARAYVQEALRVNDKNAGAYYGSGYIYYLQSRPELGLKHLDRALELNPEIPNAYVLKNKIYYDSVGDFKKCLETSEQLLELANRTDDLWYQGVAIHWMGVACDILGQYAKAIDYYQRALRLQREAGNRQGEGDALNGLGVIYGGLGNYAKAIAFYSQALQMWQKRNDRKGEGTALHNIGALYAQEGNYRKAFDYYQRALKIRQAAKDATGEGFTLYNLGLAYAHQRRYREALDHFNKALAIRRDNQDAAREGVTLNSIGYVYGRLGDHEKAVEYQTQALQIAQSLNGREDIWRSHADLGHTLEGQGKLDEALRHYRSSVQTIEDLRGGLQLGAEYKAGFLQNRIQAYERIIHLLYKLHTKNPATGYDRQAFDYAERGKARAFLDTLAEAHAQVRQGMSESQIEQERAIFRELSAIQAGLRRRPPEPEKTRLSAALKAAEDKLEDFKNQMRQANPRYARLQYPEPYDLARVQKDLVDARHTILAFMLGAERSFLWRIAPDGVQMVALPSRAEIERKVRAYRKLLSEPPDKGLESFAAYHQQGYALFKMLMGPVQSRLGKTKELVIIPDGILYYLPFETLITSFARPPGAAGAAPVKTPRYLLDAYDIAYVPSASILGSLKSSRHAPGTQLDLLAYGDPVFRRQPVLAGTRAAPRNRQTSHTVEPPAAVRSVYPGAELSFDPLPHSRREVEAIASLYPKDRRRVYLGARATETAVKREDLSKYRRIHFATHGIIDEQVPGRSGLVLSFIEADKEDGILQMNEIFHLELNAELVVLSACQSGLGKLVRGEGMVGLTRAFMYAGAENLVVSLWSVNDESTAEFMKSFYRHMQTGKSHSEALRRAKRELLHSATPAYHFPYFWAPFVLVGQAE